MVERRRRITAAVQYGCLLMQRLWHAVLYIVCGVEREPSSISTQIARWNAGLELHPVITQDGITLTMHRIVPNEDKGSKGANNPPVLLLHGLFESSVVWTAQVWHRSHRQLSLTVITTRYPAASQYALSLNMHCLSVSQCLCLTLSLTASALEHCRADDSVSQCRRVYLTVAVSVVLLMMCMICTVSASREYFAGQQIPCVSPVGGGL